MRLTNKVSNRVAALGLVALLGACAHFGDDTTVMASADGSGARISAIGPAGDYPVVLGEPFLVDGELFSPVDTMSYDEVGYAAPDNMGGSGITAAHKTLPLPSYVEVTSLVTGKTILARVERRGPMTSDRLISLSTGAQAQLGSADGAPVRVRRVNPPEAERAKLRMGMAVSERMETPLSLVAVLKRKLPERGSANLGNSNVPGQIIVAAEPVAIPVVAVPPSKAAEQAKEEPTFDSAFKPTAPAPAEYARATVEGATPKMAVAPIAAAATPLAQPITVDKPGKFVVQAAAFSSKGSAEKVATSLGGFVQPAGRYFRVRVGPFSNRGQADAALAKVRAAGYSDARISTAG